MAEKEYTREGKCQSCKRWFEVGLGDEGICLLHKMNTDEDYTCEQFEKGIPKSLLEGNTMEELRELLKDEYK